MLLGLDAVSLKSIEDEARANVDKVTLMNLGTARRMKPDQTHIQYIRAKRNLNYLRRNAGKMLSEVVARHFENALALYKALPRVLPFHRSNAQTRLVVGSNKAGKSMAVASEVARIVRGKHPTRQKNGGTILCVGLDEDHLNHMWEDLLTKSLFKVVPDEITGVPRAVRPDPLNHRQIDPIDEARKELWRDSPPFIPPEEWDYEGGIVYRERGKNVPAQVRIRSTGWKMLFYPSGGNPRRGISVNEAWFDEEIANSIWFTEVMARLIKANGNFMWSATPQTQTEDLLKIHNRFARAEPDIEEFQIFLEDNPYMSAESKLKLYNSIAEFGEDELAVRYYGQWAILGRRVYNFDMTGPMRSEGWEA